ncbi:hypothetical protein D3502_22645 [Salmonella enterica]|nr:hypothetical protein [Salmonella enterica]
MSRVQLHVILRRTDDWKDGRRSCHTDDTDVLLFLLIWGVSCLVQSVIVVTFFTYRLKITPNYILSRVVSVTRLLSYLAIPVAALSGGWRLDKSGNVNILYILSAWQRCLL